MTGLRDPVVRALTQAPDAFGDRRRPGADEQREARQGDRDPADVVDPGHGGIDDHGVEPHRGDLFRACGVRNHLTLPAQRGEPPIQHGEKTAVVIDERDPDRRRIMWRSHLTGSVETGPDVETFAEPRYQDVHIGARDLDGETAGFPGARPHACRRAH